MILHPGILALLVSSGLITFLVLVASWFGARILAKWDLSSGSSLQLELERRTYLISTVLAYVCAFQLLSLFLFIYTADSLSPLFVGAMCAVGSLNVNGYGYPVLALKVVNFLLAGLWLVLNAADNRAEDYPLIRRKYGLLMQLAPLVVTEAALQALYLLNLRPDVITSCCGSLFSQSSSNAAASLASFPVIPTAAAAILSFGLAIAAGVLTARTGRGASFLALTALASLLAGIASLITFIGPYAYELPTHHCPFCVLQKEYGYFGYLFYGFLMGGTLAGLGSGMLSSFRKVPSLLLAIPAMQKRLALLSIIFYSTLVLISCLTIYLSDLRL